MSSYSEGQTHQLMESLEAKGLTPDYVTKLGQYRQWDDLRAVLDGQAVIVYVVQAENSLDTTIRVDRSVRPDYPGWVRPMRSKLEKTGRDEYDLSTVGLWRRPDQSRSAGNAEKTYEYLCRHGVLGSCLSFHDAVEIQKRGAAVFRKVFGNETVYFWGSMGRHCLTEDIVVPCLFELNGQVQLSWADIGHDGLSGAPAVCFGL